MNLRSLGFKAILPLKKNIYQSIKNRIWPATKSCENIGAVKLRTKLVIICDSSLVIKTFYNVKYLSFEHHIFLVRYLFIKKKS